MYSFSYSDDDLTIATLQKMKLIDKYKQGKVDKKKKKAAQRAEYLKKVAKKNAKTKTKTKTNTKTKKLRPRKKK